MSTELPIPAVTSDRRVVTYEYPANTGPVVLSDPGSDGRDVTRLRVTEVVIEVEDGEQYVTVKGEKVNKDGSRPERSVYAQVVYNDEVRDELVAALGW